MSQVEFVRYVVIPLTVALIGFGGYVVSKKAQKGSRENNFIDQLQEEAAERRRENDDLRKRMSALEARDRVYIPHILYLNRHINENKGPPAPPLPEVIQSYLDST